MTLTTGWKAIAGAVILGVVAVLRYLAAQGSPELAVWADMLMSIGAGLGILGIRHKQNRDAAELRVLKAHLAEPEAPTEETPDAP